MAGNNTPTSRAIVKTKYDASGEDAYSYEAAAALSPLSEKDYLVLPAGLPIPQVPLEFVGTKHAVKYFSTPIILSVYLLNKAVSSDTTNNNHIRFGLARMQAVVLGWYNGQRQVKLKPIPRDLLQQVAADTEAMKELLREARDAAWLVPLASEHTFRTKGHYYLSGQRTEYVRGYSNILNACSMPQVINFMPNDLLLHSAFHWITPGRVWDVMKKNETSSILPDAIKVRMTSPPSGSALVTTTAAVLRALDVGGQLESLREHNIAAIDMAAIERIYALDKKIRDDPPVYHTTPSAYGKGKLEDHDKTEFETTKEESKKLAPLLQPFCDTVCKDVPLGRQKVLRKHALDNPVVCQRAKRYFQELSRKVPTTMHEIFGRSKRLRGAGADQAGG